MPTPVSVARQCLAEEAASALDEAVAVAKRRGHSQTTSLHVISALLSSSIRDACIRARSSACSPRLQFRALELCVSVALDRVSTAKSPAEPPPVSNSLMAAIKRSQANQRRHPETFHLYQRHANSDSISAVKVELKHFVLSILDDPVVSRVFGDAGFRTNDLKWAVMNPILPSRGLNFNLEKDVASLPNFPFNLGAENSNLNSTTRRVGEVLLMKERRNPLLIGTCAEEDLNRFLDCLSRNETGAVPKEIEGLNVVSIRDELVNGEVESKFDQLSGMVQSCQGRPGVIVDCGDLKPLLDVDSVNVVNHVVSELRRLLIESGGKMWLIGSLASDQVYNRLVERFPSIEMDWDLHLVPITSSTGGARFKSSLMGSFVPFGGFFTMPSELPTLHATPTTSSSLCNSCNKKYEVEVSTTVKEKATGLNANHQSVNLPSWLSTAACETSKKTDGIEARKHDTVLDARVRALHRKWSDICQRLHCSQIYEKDISKTRSQILSVPSFHSIPSSKDTAAAGLSINGSKTADSNLFIPKRNISRPVFEDVVNVPAEVPLHGISSSDVSEPSASQQELIVPIACTSSSSVTTNLGLGTFYASSEGCKSSKAIESTSGQFADKHVYIKDLENQWKVLAEKLYWQTDAIRTISRTVSCHRSSKNGNVCLSFLGPDKVGKKKIAAGMAEIVFGGKENLLSLDLRSRDVNHPNTSIIDCYDLKYERLKSGRKMIVDYLAEELSKRPNSVVVLENIELADILVQSSLSQAIRTGKFPDSRGRDINVNNVIFVLTSASLKVGRDPPLGRPASEFTEESILEAKNVQIQILIRSSEGNINSSCAAKVSVVCSKPVSVNKRKLIGCESSNAEILKRSRSIIDLNLPVEDMEEDYSDAEKCDSKNDNSQSSGKSIEEFLDNVDQNVVFQPFDFDTLAREILNEIDVKIKRIAGTNKVLLEIDREVMLQILAAAWVTDRKDMLQDWIENVICLSIKECLQKCNFASGIVLQLLPLDGAAVEELACGLYLPSRIIIN